VAEIKQVLVPDIGDYKDVSIIEVMVKAGDTIKAEDNLVTLETDKAAMEVPSPYAGVIKEIKVKVGDKVSQGWKAAPRRMCHRPESRLLQWLHLHQQLPPHRRQLLLRQSLQRWR
jgi:hypothetical protein